MVTMTYRLGGRVIRVETLYMATHDLCRAYVTEAEADFSVTTTGKDIEFERGRADWPSSEAYLETLAVYRKIAEKLPEYDTFLFHGSCICVEGMGYLFTAKSGTGKSTHAHLWRELLGVRAVMVNDDKPLIRVTDGGAVAYGTPWDGKHRLSNDIAVPLKAVCVLERAAENHIRSITPSEALPVLLQQIYRPMNAEAMVRTLQLIDRLAGAVKLWRLGCNMDIEAAKVAYHAMKG